MAQKPEPHDDESFRKLHSMFSYRTFPTLLGQSNFPRKPPFLPGETIEAFAQRVAAATQPHDPPPHPTDFDRWKWLPSYLEALALGDNPARVDSLFDCLREATDPRDRVFILMALALSGSVDQPGFESGEQWAELLAYADQVEQWHKAGQEVSSWDCWALFHIITMSWFVPTPGATCRLTRALWNLKDIAEARMFLWCVLSKDRVRTMISREPSQWVFLFPEAKDLFEGLIHESEHIPGLPDGYLENKRKELIDLLSILEKVKQ